MEKAAHVRYTAYQRTTRMTPPAFHPTNRPVRKRSARSILVRVGIFMACAAVFVFLGAGIHIFFQVNHAAQTVSIRPDASPSVLGAAKAVFASRENQKPLRGEEDGRINILLLGKAGEAYAGRNLTDTIIVASVDTETHRAALLSIPRDTLAKLPDSDANVKVNTLYARGLEKENPFEIVRETISDITGLPIHYALSVDYDGFSQVINALGGVNVMVERDIYDTRFPGPNYSYETFALEKGFHTLDGETALKYVRERHSDPRGDFGRAARQQQVVRSVKDKIMSTRTFLNPFAVSRLLTSLEENVRTDMGIEEIPRAISLMQETDLANIETVVVDAWRPESLLRVSHVYLDNGQRMFALVPRTGNFDEVRELAEHVFDYSYLEKRKEAIVSEKASAVLLYSGNFSRAANNIRQLLLDAGLSEAHTAYSEEHSIGETRVADMTDKRKPYALDEIIRLLGATPSSEIPERDIYEDYNFYIYLGDDVLETFDYEQASVEELENSEK